MKRIFSGILILSMGLLVHIGTVEAMYYYNFMITVSPESPTIYDEVYVTVCFDTAYINYVVNFSTLSQNGNEFFSTVDIYVPKIGLPAIGYAEETYYLGELPEDSYTFNVDVRVWYMPTGWLLESTYFGKTFTVITNSNIIVPDDYQKIQEAINYANEGDTIFVRNGVYYEHVVVNKTVSLIGEDASTTVIIHNDTDSAVHICADNVTLRGFEISFSDFQISWGIVLDNCSNCIVSGNVVKAVEAILVDRGSRNHISDNKVLGLPFSCVFEGLQIFDSDNNVVTRNYLSYDCHNALRLFNSHNNYIASNFIAGHSVPFPIIISNSNNNSIIGNTIWPSFFEELGYIHFSGSSNNILYHNNFQADESSIGIPIASLGMNNIWDNGCEGNYWRNYNGTDTSTPLDGIGDTYLPWEEVDYYPLMNPYWNPTDINHDLKVDIKDLATAALAFGSYPGYPNWNPHADITGPEYLVPDSRVDIRDIALIAVNFGEVYS